VNTIAIRSILILYSHLRLDLPRGLYPSGFLGIYLSIYLSLCLSIYLSIALQSLVGPWPFFSFLILYTIGRTPWTGDQSITRPLPTHRTTQTQNKRTQTLMP
jgi:hypothetical protein